METNDRKPSTPEGEKKLPSIGDILVYAAEALHWAADDEMEAETSSVIKLKSTGLRYKVTITVELAE